MKSPKKNEVFQTPEQLNDFVRQNPDHLVNYCLSQPQWKPFADMTKMDVSPQGSFARWMAGLLKYSLELLLARPAGFIGRGFVSEEAYAISVRLAISVSIATGLNVFGLWPLLLYAFGALPFGGIASAGFGVFLLKLMNISGESAAANNPRARKASYGWLSFFIAMSVFSTVAGGIGAILLLGQAQLSGIFSERIIAERVMPDFEASISDADKLMLAQQKLQDKCDAGVREISALEEGSVARNDAYRTLYGPFGTPPEFWEGKPDAQLPLCVLAPRRESQAVAAVAQAQGKLVQARQDLSRLQAQRFLQEQYPEVFQAYFETSGELKDKDQAVTLAMNLFAQRIAKGNIADFGSAGFVFGLSVITSIACVVLILQHSYRSDIKQSHVLKVVKIRRDLFNAARDGIRRLPTKPSA